MPAPSYFCRFCRHPVRKNYDHVGDCDGGTCSGTFEHVKKERGAVCPRLNCELAHHEVCP